MGDLVEQSHIRFGRFGFDLAQRRLFRDGTPVELIGKPLDILCILAATKDKVVTKDELMAQVWPGLVVEENNIQVHVSALRKVLDEGADGQSFIVTVPGRGYRLTGQAPELNQVTITSQNQPAAHLSGASIAVLSFVAIRSRTTSPTVSLKTSSPVFRASNGFSLSREIRVSFIGVRRLT